MAIHLHKNSNIPFRGWLMPNTTMAHYHVIPLIWIYLKRKSTVPKHFRILQNKNLLYCKHHSIENEHQDQLTSSPFLGKALMSKYTTFSMFFAYKKLCHFSTTLFDYTHQFQSRIIVTHVCRYAYDRKHRRLWLLPSVIN